MIDITRDVNIDTNDSLLSLKQIPNETIDLCMTSPPYNIGKSYESRETLDTYLSWIEKILFECYRVLKNQGSIVLQVGNFVNKGVIFPLDIYIFPILDKLGFILRNRIIWHFEHGLHCSNRLSGRYEVILWLTKSNEYTFNLDAVRIPSKYPNKKHFKGARKGQLSGNPLGKNPSDFWRFLCDEYTTGIYEIPNVKHNHPEKLDHPCQYPIELAERCILAFSNENDLVIDPFGGVGTTAIASIKNSRRIISIDRDTTYSEITMKRINQLKNDILPIREIGTPIYSPKREQK
jgi:adenine-specific DNA-methyltransferase